METVAAGQKQLKVLLLSGQGRFDSALTGAIEQRCGRVQRLGLDDFERGEDRLDVIGAAVIQAGGIEGAGLEKLRHILGRLEQAGIGSIVIDKPGGLDLSGYVLAEGADAARVDELCARVSTHIAHRARVFRRTGGGSSAAGEKADDQRAGVELSGVNEQLRMAGQVQRDFLPKELPNSDRYRWAVVFRPAEWVSGDLYDVTRLDERHIGFYVADAVGHSMPAALLTMFLKQALVMRTTSGHKYRIYEPAEVMSRLNGRMYEQKLSGCQFATCCYCLLNVWTRQLTFCRAGHPYPVLIKPDGTLKHLESRGALLGVFEQARHKQETVQLEAGDKLILYSDGVEDFIGATDESGSFAFSEEFRRISRLPAESMLRELERAIDGRLAGGPQFDDITLVGLELL